MKKLKVFIVIIFMFVCNILPNSHSYAVSGIQTLQPPENIQSIRKSDTSIRIQWRAVADADGYMIYKYKRSAKKYIRVHSVKNVGEKSKLEWTDKNLKTNKIYKYKIASYKIINEKKQVSALSDWVSAKTYKRNSKKINARAPKVSKKEIYLGLCSAKKVTAYVKPSKYGKNKKKTPISNKVRWSSSNPAVATVNKKGVITAGEKAGTCTIYAKSHNGTRTKIKVIVKNYARAKSYDGRFLEENDIFALVTDYKTQIQNIAEYYSIHRINKNETIHFSLNDDAKVVITPVKADTGNLEKDIETLLVDFPYYINVEVTSASVTFVVRKEDSPASLRGEVCFFFDNNCSSWQSIRIASHWVAWRLRPI